MATVNATQELIGDHSVKIFTYAPITASNADGAPIPFAEWADRSVQFTGTFGAAATIIWEGSNDGTNYAILTDPQGNNISKTAAAIEGVLEITRWARPRLASGGDGSTSIVTTVLCRRQNSMRT
jgi:hypothetical protein